MEEILFETRRHTSRPYIPNYPPQHQQLNEGAKNSCLSRLLSSTGFSGLKERWRKDGHPAKIRRCASLFVSPRGDLVAVASGNQITILQKDDDYKKPCGIFICKNITSFIYGAWSETHDVLGVTDDSGTVYLIRANGKEITRFPKSHIKSSSPIVGLIVVAGDADLKKSCVCTFSILTTDGLIHDIEISQDPSASVFSPLALNSGTMLKQFSENMFFLDYHPELSLFAIVGSIGSSQLSSNGLYSLSLCRKNENLILEVVVSTQFDGFFSMPKGYVGRITSPKVLISPQGTFVATLDIGGSLITFKFDNKQCSLSKFSYGGGNESQQGNKGNNLASEVIDFAWWSDNILAVAERDGKITLFNVSTGFKVIKDETMISLPILERVPQLLGRLFLLETKPSVEGYESEEFRASGFHLLECDRGDFNNRFDYAKLWWSLISFSERSIPEMYDIFISRQEYQAALAFANRHGLDKDEALKSQWFHSSQGINEIKTLLSEIKDQAFVLSECVALLGPTEDAVRALLDLGLCITDRYRFCEAEVDEHNKVWDYLVARLKLLQYRDRLETFLGINMGRFSLQEYKKFCNLPIKEAAVALAESGKIGALNLLFKRHPYSLTCSLLDVLAAIPETLPVQTYVQLLPGSSPPPSISLREEDWVECDEMVTFIISRVPESDESYNQIRTEPIVKQFMGSQWPSVSELSSWYIKRARDIDTLSGQLDNSMCLVDFACRKGIHQLQPLLEEISFLHQLIYAEENEDMNFTMSLTVWGSLSDYERFKLMLTGVNEDSAIKRLCSIAIPFMKKRFHVSCRDEKTDCSAESFLVRWLKEMASENKLEMCCVVIEEGSRDFQNNSFFQNEVEVVDCALQCIYACSVTDRWNMMASILSKLPFSRDSEAAGLKERVRLAEGHIEAGRILALYQVPKPIGYFQATYSDEKSVKQIIRLILSKFVRRQPVRSDTDWANIWLDLQSLQENAFHFVDVEYMLMEFCRGLLKAGKFSLARNYLKGVGSVSLANDKAENLVIQAAREYFFSASSLSSSEIWKAKECLSILPNSRNVRLEADIIDAVTVKLPNLGVTLLPMQFRQIKDPMEIIKLVVTSQGGAYLNVDEIIELAKLLGLSSHDDISAVQETIAREATVVGDLQLAFDLCLVLAKKGHGSVWELCAALARGPALDNMDIASRKQLLGFALSHCDAESIADLLHAWKDLDMHDQCESVMLLTGKEPGNALARDSTIADLKDWSDQEAQLKQIENRLFQVAKDVPMDGDQSIPSMLRESGKLLSFAAVYLPWLLVLSQEAESSKKFTSTSFSGVRTQAATTIMSWLARNGFAPQDSLISSVAKSIMEPPVSEEEDIIGCSYLLNLADAFSGVDVIERNLRTREKCSEITSVMNVGMIYSLLHNSGIKCENPAQRRELLLTKFQQKHALISSAANCNNTAAGGIANNVDASNRFTNTLIALKSTQLVSSISPGLEIRPEDLSTVESTVSCFLKVSKLSVSESHVKTLLAILKEWEGHFTRGQADKDSGESSDGGNSWSNDDWDDEGWESLQEPIEKEPNKAVELSVHPLHVCWMEIFKKLLAISWYNQVLKLLDETVSKPGVVLLDEESARGLSQIETGVDFFLALKLMLLLPYEQVQLQCLDIVEQKLKQGVPDKIGTDLEFLLLVLSSGVISRIIVKPSYGTIFSYICYTVGNLCRQCQESQLSSEHVDLFIRLIFPCFVVELVKSGQQILAGFLVAKLMHTNPSLSLMNIAGACLTKYLERQIQILEESNSSWKGVEPLLNTVSSLRDRMRNLLQSSVSLLSQDST